MADVKTRAPKAGAKNPETGKPVGRELTVSFDFGEGLADMVNKFGEPAVLSHAERQLVVSLQAFVRQGLETGMEDEAIAARVVDWKPGQVSRLGGGAVTTESAMAHFEGLSPDAQAQFIAVLEEKASNPVG